MERMTRRALWALLFCAVVQAAHVVPLHKRSVTKQEQQQLLEFLQLGEDGPEDDKIVSANAPNVLLNSNFFGNIEIGESKQKFEVVFDTGSSVLWVYSEKCASCKEVLKHTFAVDKSPTFKARDIPFAIRYGTGESKGTTGVDEIFIADLEVNNQPFGQCEQPDDVMRGFPFDGIVGLSRALVSDPNAMPTIINTIKKDGLLENKNLANTFSFYIGRESNDPTYLIFGGSHEMLEDEKTMHWTSTLNKNIYWEVPLDDIFIHHKEQAATETRHPSHHYLEQHPHLGMHEDRYASMQADPELSLLELESTVSALLSNSKGHPNAKSHNDAKSHHDTKTHHDAKAHPYAKKHPALHTSNKHKTNVRHHTETKDFEEGKIAVRTHTPATQQATLKRSPEAENDNDDVGSGQLMSNFHKPGASMQPCKQDDLHMCIISVDSGHSLMSGPPDIVKPIKEQLTPKVTDKGCTEEGDARSS